MNENKCECFIELEKLTQRLNQSNSEILSLLRKMIEKEIEREKINK